MKDLFQSAAHLQEFLQGHSIDSMVIGGIAVALYGEPRLTQDVDVKVLLEREKASYLIELLKPKWNFLTPKPKETLQRLGFVFLKDTQGLRLDVLLAETPYDQEAIKRSKLIKINPKTSIKVCSPEDLILYKMISTRAKDREDVKGIYLKQKDLLDSQYILKSLKEFEQALDDSTLVEEFKILSDSKGA